MGVSGLTSFIDQCCSSSNKILDDLKLHDTLLLIDGYSFLYRMHSVHNIQSAYGGNYDELAAKLSNLFELFAKCKIEPIVVLDGGRDVEDRKFQTALKRNSARLKEVANVNDIIKNKLKKNNVKNGQFISQAYHIAKRILPIMAYRVFIDVLNKYDVTHFQTCFEADYELACLANELKCPILSFDSDYYVYDLKYGYISIGFLELDTRKSDDLAVCDDDDDEDDSGGEGENEPDDDRTSDHDNEAEEGSAGQEEECVGETAEDMDFEDFTVSEDNSSSAKVFYIPARIYRLENLLKYFSSPNGKRQMTREKMAILAVLLGNDYVDRSLFRSLFSTFDSTNNNLKFKRLKRQSAGYAKKKKDFFNKIFNWLAAFSSTEEATNLIVSYIAADKRELVKTVITDSIRDYLCKKESNCHFYKNFIFDRIGSRLAALSLTNDSTAASPGGDRHFQESNLKTKSGKIISDDFLMKYFQCQMPRFALDILVHHRVLFPCQIEVSYWPSSYLTSLPVRECYYRLLLNSCQSVAQGGQEEEQSDHHTTAINEYLRHQNSTKIYEIKLDLTKDKSSRVDQAFVLKDLFHFENQLVQKLLRSDQDGDELEKIKSLFVLIFFWLTRSFDANLADQSEYAELNEFKTLNFLRMFIVAFIKCSIVTPCFWRMRKHQKLLDAASKSTSSDSANSPVKFYTTSNVQEEELLSKHLSRKEGLDKLIDEIASNHEANYEYIRQLHARLNSYSLVPEASMLSMSNVQKIFKIFNVRLIHCLNEFQAIFHSLSFINVLKLPELGAFFNGSFLHNFYHDLSNRSYPDLFIEELFGRKSLFKCLYVDLYQMFLGLFGQDLEKHSHLRSSISSASAQGDQTGGQTSSRRQKRNAKVKRLNQD